MDRSKLCSAARAKLCAIALVLWIPGVSIATPLYDYFGPLSEATFGGSGIPNDEVAVASQWEDGNVLITVALSATPRFSNPAVTNDGAGTYYAQTGSNYGGAGESPNLGALWNFNYFVKVEGINGATPVITDYNVKLYYDFDTGLDTPKANLGVFDLTAYLSANSLTSETLVQDSQNLLFDWLTVPVTGIVTPPSGSFDPNAIGEYNFGIEVSRDGWGVENVRMDVQTVPIPAAIWLFGSGFLGLIVVSRRK